MSALLVASPEALRNGLAEVGATEAHLVVAHDELMERADGSIDLSFGPEAAEGLRSNWIQTVPGTGVPGKRVPGKGVPGKRVPGKGVPGKRWPTLPRLWGSPGPWFDPTWRPGGSEPV